MKKTMIVFAALFFASSCATEFNVVSDDVPQAVLNAFKAKYPEAKEVKWEAEKHEGRLVFEGAWKEGKKEKEAAFKPDGTFVKEE